MESYGEDSHKLGIFGQRFDAEANRVGERFQINTFERFDQENPQIGTHFDGSFVVIWDSDKQDTDGNETFEGYYGQLFDK